MTRLGIGCNKGAVPGVEFVKLPRESLKILYWEKREQQACRKNANLSIFAFSKTHFPVTSILPLML